ncbi:unnamed protein product [Adineta steineri]|uniref:Uncharacterized protein n=1 Tax=Adineta steineri TaxID=433720 RepID=A0A813TNH4_9BILA|nr:unnamed protein product [Adineta steineri]CAF0813748.1 unnamed protein product [Adineta steineri]
MFIISLFLLFLFASLSDSNLSKTKITKTTTLSTIVVNHSNGKIVDRNSSIIQVERKKIDSTDDDVITPDEIKNEVFVNDLLETDTRPDVIAVPELYQGPHYEIDWHFVDKYTIRVTFDLFSVPTSLIENNIYSNSKRKSSLSALMATMPSRPFKSIMLLEYFVFIIRPYHKNKEIILKMEKLNLKNTTSKPYLHFSNSLLLTALNHKEKYSICISYYRQNTSTKIPDLLLCQDIINDYSKFSELRADAKHGLLFITTQYSIIIALLVVLQSVFTMRKRRVAQLISKQLHATAHSIRSTLSSVSLVRQSVSSLDAAAELQQHQHQHHATNHSHAIPRQPTIDEETKMKKRIISSPAIVLSEPSVSIDNDTHTTDENEPFLKRIPSKNHVHFLLGPGEDDDGGEHDDIESHTLNNSQTASNDKEPYSDQSDALLSMAHILDTNKPWSRHSHQTSPV